ncbi:hypothetical protein MKY30_23905 [Oceanobacillus sp. FSL W8-0428]|uniref:hypothetical protein n=1 Tax=Oceanobacillus sp. FSL W8-0428 TaxID=2921715 RepID=UPI0030F9715D
MIEEKIKQLKIKPIDDDIYHKHLKPMQLRGIDISQWKYYKITNYGPMFFTDEYLSITPIEELMKSDSKLVGNKTIAERIDSIMFRIQLVLWKWKHKIIGNK